MKAPACPGCGKKARHGEKSLGFQDFDGVREEYMRGAWLCKNKECDVDEVLESGAADS